MPTIRFTGKIIPMRPPHEIGALLPFHWEDKETGERELYEITFDGADVSANVTITQEINEDNVSRYRNTAMELARTALNIVCFVEGLGLILYLDKYLPTDGEPQLLVSGDPRLRALITLTGIDVTMVANLLAQDPQLNKPLSDLVAAITWPLAAPINCARALEGIRRHNNPKETDKTRLASWRLLQKAINISEEYAESIMQISINARHGGVKFIPPIAQEEAIMRSWIIMDRYLHFLNHGRVPLENLSFLLL